MSDAPNEKRDEGYYDGEFWPMTFRPDTGEVDIRRKDASGSLWYATGVWSQHGESAGCWMYLSRSLPNGLLENVETRLR